MRRKRRILVVKRIHSEARPAGRVRLTRDSFPIPHAGDASDDLRLHRSSSRKQAPGSLGLSSLLKVNQFTLDHMAAKHKESRVRNVRRLSPETKSRDRSWRRILSQ